MSRRIEPEDLYSLLGAPDLVDPVMVCHFDGWIDAGQAGNVAANHLIKASEATVIARFDTEWLLDHRARRPVMAIVDGVFTGIEWPTIELHAGRDLDDRDVLVLHGAEPDHNWRAFQSAVLQLAERFGVERIIGLGAYPAAAPHTREPRIAITSPNPERTSSDEAPASIDVPAGMAAALEMAATVAGIDAFTIWAQVPHYVPSAPYPPAAVALLERLAQVGVVRVNLSEVQHQALTARRRLDHLISAEESHQDMLRDLERQFDESAHDPQLTLPTSDEIGAQFEEFLRLQDGDEPAGDDA